MAPNREQVLQSAEKLLSKGKLDQALREYVRVLEDNPRDISTLNKVGDLYVRMNRPTDSIPFFERIADFYSTDGFFLKAIAIYKKINKIDPARLEVYEKLADLYHKQGLVQDARSQFQVLADHYQKNNRLGDAISVYKKMASIDPADLRIQVRLADLYRAAGQKDEAVMQYGLIGSMLLKRGAHDEAAQVFQKALDLSPDDVETQRNLVRSLLAQKNATAAMALLRAAPRTGESLGLMAEAQLEMGQRAEAVRTAEQALALDAHAETPRLFLSRLRVQEHALDKAVTVILPVVDAAVARREFARAAELLEPILTADPAQPAALEKMAQVLEAEGNRAALAKVHVTLGQVAERQQNPAAALAHYRRAQQADPSNIEAATHLKDIGPPTEPVAPVEEPHEYQELVIDLEDSASVHAPQPKVPSIEWEEQAAAPVAPSAAAANEERQLETLIVEAEVFAKYGLVDKAIERLVSVARRRPDLLKARERLVELLAESKNPALRREAEALAEACRQAGRADDASRVLALAGIVAARAEPTPPSPAEPPPPPRRAAPSPPPRRAERQPPVEPAPPPRRAEPPQPPVEPAPLPAGPPPALGHDVEFEEFDVGHPVTPPAEVSRFALEALDFGDGEAAGPPPSVEKLSTPPPQTPRDTEFVSYEQLGNLLEDEMQRAGGTEAAASAEVPVVEEENLFADEQKFFNLAEELEKELGDEAVVEDAAEISVPQGEVSLEDIFREFKKGVEQQLSAEDYETHYNLGIAYKEMGLVDEAIGEFQLASKDPGRAVECCSMLGHCFLEKGMPQLGIKWFRKGLETPAIGDVATAGMLYDLAHVYQDTGDMDLAYKTFQEVSSVNANYRDVVQRVKDLEAVRKHS